VEKFRGLTLHSHDYRIPESFKDRSVLVFGAGPSGTDIAIEISPFVKKVTRLAPVIFSPDKGGGKCVCPRFLSVCLSVSKITQKRMHGFGEMLRVDRCRDMDELSNF